MTAHPGECLFRTRGRWPPGAPALPVGAAAAFSRAEQAKLVQRLRAVLPLSQTHIAELLWEVMSGGGGLWTLP